MEGADKEEIQPQRRAARSRSAGRKDPPQDKAHRQLPRQSGDARIPLRARRREDRLPGDSLMQRALVTGGTKGVGEAVLAALAEAGATVLTTARSRPAHLPHPDHFIAADVSTAEGCAVVAKAVRDRFGGLDLVVHVVGGS